MKFPNPIRIDFGEGMAVRVRREEDAGFTAELVLLAYGWNTDTGRVARRDPAGALTGDPELVAAFPELLAQWAAERRGFLAGTRFYRDFRDKVVPAAEAEARKVADWVQERAESLARQAQEAEDAGRLDECLAIMDELKQLHQEYSHLYGREG